MNAEFDPLTKLMEKVRGDEVETETVSDRVADLQCFVTTSELNFCLLFPDHPSQCPHAVQCVTLAHNARSTLSRSTSQHRLSHVNFRAGNRRVVFSG